MTEKKLPVLVYVYSKCPKLIFHTYPYYLASLGPTEWGQADVPPSISGDPPVLSVTLQEER